MNRLNTEIFVTNLHNMGVQFFTGVPDSLLSDFGNYLYKTLPEEHHVIAANEGNAIALAAGSYMASGNIPLVYLQNSGLGNTINPLLSMADNNLYAIPMIVLVGWRGRDGVHDAEQHLQQGPATPKLIAAMNYPMITLSKDEDKMKTQIDEVIATLKKTPQPYFILVEEKSFEPYPYTQEHRVLSTMNREDALRIIAEATPEENFVVTTTGKTSREWFEVQEQLQKNHARDFLTVGSMGHSSSIALGMALNSTNHILCIDGDGSMLMHMGALAVAGKFQRENFRYILINNFSHESVGGLPTPLHHVDFDMFFRSLGFTSYRCIDNEHSLRESVVDFLATPYGVLEIRVNQGSRDNLSRPRNTARESVLRIRQEFNKK